MVKALRYKSGVTGIFSVASDSSMCPETDSVSKSEYQYIPGDKGGRCVRLTTYHLHVPIVKKSGGLNLLEPCRLVQACYGPALLLPFTLTCNMLYYTHTHIFTYINTHTHIYIYIYLHTYIYIFYIHTHRYIYIFTYINIYIYLHT